MTPPIIKTSNLYLTHISLASPDQLAGFFAKNLDHLSQTNPLPFDVVTSPNHWAKKIEESRVDLANQIAYRFVLWRLIDGPSPTSAIQGMASLTQIARGPFQACYLGYAIDHANQGKGLMFEAVQGVVKFAFEDLKLHRVMANYVTSNARSARLLERMGFETEGLAKKYLLLNGEWRDHVLTSLINPNWQPPRPC